MNNEILEIKPMTNTDDEWYKANGCVYVIYKKNKPLFYNLEISKANISRIIHLSTYMSQNKSGLLSIQNRNWKGQFNLYLPMSKSQMREILNLTYTSFSNFLNNVKKVNLLFESNGNYFLNSKYFTRNKNIKIKKDEGMQKLYIKPIRLLCGGYDSIHDKSLSSIFQLIPFINYPTNILCFNTDLNNKLVPITNNCMSELIGVKNNKGNIRKAIKSMNEFEINFNENIIKPFEIIKILNSEFYYINKNIMYNNYEESDDSLYIDFKYIKPERKEITFLNDLEKVLKALRINGIRQYRVFDYRIDYYIPSLNIAIEYDENNHKNYTYEQHEGRQKKIEKELGCKFIRISDEFTNEENVLMVMDSIREICKS